MALVRVFRLRWRAAARLAAYNWGLDQGMTADRARAYSQMIYPPTLDDLAFESGHFPKRSPRRFLSLSGYFTGNPIRQLAQLRDGVA